MKRSLLVCAVLVGCGGAQSSTTLPGPGGSATATGPGGTATATAGAVKSGPPTKVRTVEGITEYKLDNGLQILLFPDPSQSTVTVNITYLVGSRVEGYGETGMAHLLEHMLFKGSPRHRNVLKLIDERGGQANGSTWTDRTNYYETLPASPENLDWALDLEADRMVNASISPDDLKTEFSVVRNEFEIGENNPAAVLEERIVSTAYLWHNYGKSTIGSRADIERVPVPALRAFYEKYYQPDNAVLIVSGKFDEAQALATITRTFGALPRPSRPLQQSYTVEPVQDGERSVTLRRNGETATVGIAYHTVGGASPDYPAVKAALDLLVREPSGRLYKKLVETKLATSVSADQIQFRDPYLAVISAELRDVKNVDKVEQAMTAELEGLGAAKLDAKEVERWRAATLKNLELALANSQLIAIELSEFAALGDWRTLFAYRDRVAATTVDDVRRVAATYFKQSNRTVGRFIPTKTPDRAPLTDTPDVASIVKGIEGGAGAEAGEAFAATLDTIERRTTRKQLAGGIEAAFLPKKTRGGKVELQLALHWGTAKALQGKQAIAQLTAAMLIRGTAKKTYQELQDLEDQLKAKIYVDGGADGFTLHIETLRDQLPAALDLAAEILKTPSFPAKELELIKQEWLAQLEQQTQDPNAIAFTLLQQLTAPWPKTDPRYTMSPAEQIAAIKAVKLADVKAFYKTFVGAGHGELAVVGDHDAGAIGAQIEALFGTWTSKQPYARLGGKVFGAKPTEKSIDIKDKEMTMLAVGHDVAMKDTDADYAAWLMVGQILGGDTGSRLWMRMRENEGMSYGTGAWTYADSFDSVGGVGAFAMLAPQNLARAKAALREEFDKIAGGKIDAAELQRAKDAWIKAQDTNLSNDDYLVGMLNGQSYRKRTTAFATELRAKIQAVTPADLNRVATQYVGPDKLVIIDAGDLSKAAAPAAPAKAKAP
jgi:zinc protease